MHIEWLYFIGGAGLGISIKSLIETIADSEEPTTNIIRVVLWTIYVIAVHFGSKRNKRRNADSDR